MVVGRSAPRYQEMTTLHPRSKSLQRLGIEYIIAVVDLCHHAVEMCNKSAIGQLKSVFRDFDLSSHQSKLLGWAKDISDQLSLEEAKENSLARDLVNKFSSQEALRQKLSDRARLLDACSTFDYQMAWKQARKCGDATFFLHDENYNQWKTSLTPSTLSVSGKLGAGKTVVLANIVDDVLLTTKSHAVTYFFCQSDNVDSRKGRSIVGCLARQILEALPPKEMDELSSEPRSNLSLESIEQIFTSDVLRSKHIFVILDGIDEVDADDRSHIIEFLKQLQHSSHSKFCVSYRLTADSRVCRELTALGPGDAIQMPEENPDITSFIQSRLEFCIETGKLALGDPTLILEISQALESGAQGMFLWVVLQIETICAQKTDNKIREALRCLPKDLPETFATNLTATENTLEPDYRTRLFKLILAAVRPLTIDELREALSVTPFIFTWDPSNRINEIQAILSGGGSLLFVDEEQSTVHFIHPSVKQFLFGDLGLNHDFYIPRSLAEMEIAHIVVTYLSYNVFDKQVARVPQTPNITDRKLYENIVTSALTSSLTRSMALSLLRKRRQTDFEMGKALSNFKPTNSKLPEAFPFRQYASENWLTHTKAIESNDPRSLITIRKVLKRQQEPLVSEFTQFVEDVMRDRPIVYDEISLLPYPRIPRLHSSSDYPTFILRSCRISEPLIWAIENSHLGIFCLMIRKSIRNIVSIITYLKVIKNIHSSSSLGLGHGRPLLIPSDVKFDVLTPQIYVKLFCLSAIFGKDEICNKFLRQPSPPIPLSKILEAIPLVPFNGLAIALVLVQVQALYGPDQLYMDVSRCASNKHFHTCCDVHVGVLVEKAALCACCVPRKYQQIVGQLGDLHGEEPVPRSDPNKSWWSPSLDEQDIPPYTLAYRYVTNQQRDDLLGDQGDQGTQ
ncbi:hypothetical protein F4678DRAFT_443988 [Xylaria arbuscula]|nr:hypothetical protein F4678DRAFT_443988 [Xylaria arbuscula]